MGDSLRWLRRLEWPANIAEKGYPSTMSISLAYEARNWQLAFISRADEEISTL